MGVMAPFLLSLGRRSKQASDIRDLPQNVSFFHTVHLPFPHHVHHLIPLQSSPGRLQGKEAHPRLGQSLDKTGVLLDQVIQVFDLPQFDRFGKRSAGFEVCNGFGIGRILRSADTGGWATCSWTGRA